ncbi:MAG: hypothetical protein ACRDSG_15550 [Pseudonocardiaceae bacterium]
MTFLLLAKPAAEAPAGFSTLELLEPLVEVYAQLLAELGRLGAVWVQFDEPACVADRTDAELECLEWAYRRAGCGTGASEDAGSRLLREPRAGAAGAGRKPGRGGRCGPGRRRRGSARRGVAAGAARQGRTRTIKLLRTPRLRLPNSHQRHSQLQRRLLTALVSDFHDLGSAAPQANTPTQHLRSRWKRA